MFGPAMDKVFNELLHGMRQDSAPEKPVEDDALMARMLQQMDEELNAQPFAAEAKSTVARVATPEVLAVPPGEQGDLDELLLKAKPPGPTLTVWIGLCHMALANQAMHAGPGSMSVDRPRLDLPVFAESPSLLVRPEMGS